MKTRLIVALSLLAATSIAIWLLKPGHLAADVPVTPNATRYFWWEDHRTELAYADSAGVIFVHRRAGTGYPEMQGWHTRDDVFAHFEKHLHAQGWLTAGTSYTDPVSPESRLLPAESHRHYYRPGDRHRTVTLAVWPTGGSVTGFNVVLTTANNSLLRRIEKNFD
ncbi:MAG: hypothetical protein AB7F72_07290 [Afipia sp.]